jgi:hypothetical protein
MMQGRFVLMLAVPHSTQSQVVVPVRIEHLVLPVHLAASSKKAATADLPNHVPKNLPVLRVPVASLVTVLIGNQFALGLPVAIEHLVLPVHLAASSKKAATADLLNHVPKNLPVLRVPVASLVTVLIGNQRETLQ